MANGFTRNKIAYACDSPSQFGHWYVPDHPSSDPIPVVLHIHGGFWSAQYDLSLGTMLSQTLARNGCAVWNIEYRRVGESDGTWNTMSADVITAARFLVELAGRHGNGYAFDLKNVTIIGHSSGGHLAAWLTARLAHYPTVAPGIAAPHCISQAGVLDTVGNGKPNPFLEALFGPYQDHRAIYEAASPLHHTPFPAMVTVITAGDDQLVPTKLGRRFVAAATRRGQQCELINIPGEDHFAFLNPDSACWQSTLTSLGI